MNKRMDRRTIKSLNNLHHKGNYEFNKEDFDISYEKLNMAIQQYRSLYEKWFEDNAEPKTAEEEIEMLERKIAEKKAPKNSKIVSVLRIKKNLQKHYLQKIIQ